MSSKFVKATRTTYSTAKKLGFRLDEFEHELNDYGKQLVGQPKDFFNAIAWKEIEEDDLSSSEVQWATIYKFRCPECGEWSADAVWNEESDCYHLTCTCCDETFLDWEGVRRFRMQTNQGSKFVTL